MKRTLLILVTPLVLASCDTLGKKQDSAPPLPDAIDDGIRAMTQAIAPAFARQVTQPVEQ